MTTNYSPEMTRAIEHFEERVAHMAAHFEHGAESITDECPHEVISGGHNSLSTQIETVLSLLRASEPDTFEAALDEYSGDVRLDADALYQLIKNADDKSFNLSDIADWIESHSDYYWNESEAFISTCEYVTDPENASQALDDLVLSMDYRLAVRSDDHHLKLDLAIGGPSASLLRDFGDDRLRVAWWGEIHESNCTGATDVLDWYMAGIPDPTYRNPFEE